MEAFVKTFDIHNGISELSEWEVFKKIWSFELIFFKAIEMKGD